MLLILYTWSLLRFTVGSVVELMEGVVGVQKQNMWRLSSCGSVLVLLSLLNVVEIQAQSCESPGDIPHGRYNMSKGMDSGATIIAICDEGYTLNGTTHRTCLNGSWEGRAPECEVVRCDAPPSIKGGQFDPQMESYVYNKSVKYTCTGINHVFGNDTLICSQDGTFRPDPPKCTVCPRVRIPNGYRTAGKPDLPYELLHYLDLRCEEGSRMEGDSHIVCTQDGWKPPPPTCVAVSVNPYNPQNPPQQTYLFWAILLILVMEVVIAGQMCFFNKYKRSQ